EKAFGPDRKLHMLAIAGDRSTPSSINRNQGMHRAVAEDPTVILEQRGLIGLSTKTLRSVAPSSTWAASYLHPSSAAFITTIAESSFQYTQVAHVIAYSAVDRRAPAMRPGLNFPKPERPPG